MTRTNSATAHETNRIASCQRDACRRPFAVCGPCDHARRYCGVRCARLARTAQLALAGRRYQATERGRRAHAARQARYRARHRVTHQCPGRPAKTTTLTPLTLSAGLPPTSTQARTREVSPEPVCKPPRCTFCGKQAALLRYQFLGGVRVRRRHARRREAPGESEAVGRRRLAGKEGGPRRPPAGEAPLLVARRPSDGVPRAGPKEAPLFEKCGS